jgi:hypothetical protein
MSARRLPPRAKNIGVTHGKIVSRKSFVHFCLRIISHEAGDIEIESLAGTESLTNLVEVMCMKSSPKLVVIVVRDLLQKWGASCPGTPFFGHTLEQFEAAVQASFDTRAALEALDQQRKVLLERRHTADQASLLLVKNVVNAIKGDPTQGEDGELYGALGYVRSSMRVNGRSRARANGHAQSPPAAPAGEASVKTKEEATDNKAA